MINVAKLIASIVVAIIPVAAIFITGRICPIDTNSYGTTPSFQPPGYVFPIVWTYLSLALGIVTAYHLYVRESAIELVPPVVLYAIVVILWCAWMPAFKNSREAGLVVLVASLAAVVAYLMVMGMCRQYYAWFVFPACIWLGVAAALNGSVIDHPST